MSAKPDPKAATPPAVRADQAVLKIFDCTQFTGADNCRFDVLETHWTCDTPGALAIGGEQNEKSGQVQLFDVSGLTTTGSLSVCPITSGTLRLTRQLRGVATPPGGGSDAVKIYSIKREDICLQVEPIRIWQAKVIPNGRVQLRKRAGGGVRMVYGMLDVARYDLGGEMLVWDEYTPGIKFEATLSEHPHCKLGMLQTCTGTRKYTLLNGDSFTCGTGKDGKETYLDTYFPCNCDEERDSQARKLTLRTDDCPGMDLPDTCKQVEVCETFRIYVGGRSSGGRWVSVACADWLWEATARRDGPKSPWELVKQRTSGSAPYDFKPTAEQPQWTGNVLSVGADIDKRLGRPERKDDGKDGSKDRKDQGRRPGR